MSGGIYAYHAGIAIRLSVLRCHTLSGILELYRYEVARSPILDTSDPWHCTVHHQTKSEFYALSLPREGFTDDNSFDSSDPRKIIKELAKPASQYSINLDGLVFKDDVFHFRGGYTTVSSGVLQRREGIFIKEAGLCGNGMAIRVNICSIMHCLTSLMGVSQGCYKDSDLFGFSRRYGNHQGMDNQCPSTCSDPWIDIPEKSAYLVQARPCKCPSSHWDHNAI